MSQKYEAYRTNKYWIKYRRVRNRIWRAVHEWLTPKPNMPYELWDLTPALRRLSRRLWQRRYNRYMRKENK